MAALEQAILTWIHLVSAAIWVGGSLFIGIVFSPLTIKIILVIALVVTYAVHVRVIRKDIEEKINLRRNYCSTINNNSIFCIIT